MAHLKNRKQVGYYKMPDASDSTGKGKGKGKGKGTGSDDRQFIPCPLLPDVPSIPPPRIPQPWEIRQSQQTAAAAVDNDNGAIRGTPPFIVLQGPLLDKTAAAEDDRDDIIEGTPPSPATQGPFPGLIRDSRKKRDKKVTQAKKRRIYFSPPTQVVQVTESPENVVTAEIEYVNFTPTSGTSRTGTCGSGRSAASNYSVDIDVEIERDMDPNSGSEVEPDENVEEDCPLRPLLNLRNVAAEDMNDMHPTEAVELMRLDAEEDQAIRTIAAGEVDILNFDWCADIKNFEGVREEFTESSGPTFDHSEMSPLQVFEKIWDTSIIDLIVTETNRYARDLKSKRSGKLTSRMSRWKDVDREEMWRFLGILLLQSTVVNNVEREYWYPSHEQTRIGDLSKIMPYNRFLLIKRCLHFADNTSLAEHPSKLDKIMPIVARLNEKFCSLYLPEQNVAIDESLLLWKGRLSFSQKIATKRAREGIKTYEICESRTGYLWKMEVYSGKGHSHVSQETVAVEGQEVDDEPENATSQIVFNLMRPLFGRGHTLVMDNFYNSPLLSRLLKLRHRTDTMGTLRLNREFVPEELKVKTKKNMKHGEVAFSSTKDLCVIVYMDKNIVPMISTYHQPEVGGTVKYGYFRYRPKVILDYNLSMGGIDRKDQLLSSFPLERSRNLCWYKKLFRRLLNVSVLNASVIFDHDRTGSAKLGNRSFRMTLLRGILDKYTSLTNLPPQPLPNALALMHLPVKTKTQRCKLCYQHQVRRTTVWRCGRCGVNLCIEGCYTQYHKNLVE